MTASPQHVDVAWLRDSGVPATSRFHAMWLWHNDAAHVQSDSGQKTIMPAELRGAPSIAHAALVDSALLVTWSHGQRSSFELAWLAQHDYSHAALQKARAASTPPSLTSKRQLPGHTPDAPRYAPVDKESVPSFEYADLMKSDEAVYHWLRALNEYGLALVRNSPLVDGTVTAVASRIAAPMNTIYGQLWKVAVQPNPINIAYTPGMLDLHVDLVYYESPPGVQLLHCQRFDAGVVGGESTFMDSFVAVERLRQEHPDAFLTLARVPATFQKVHYARTEP
ncbi:MAG: hypothetical protein EOO41_01810, partial [Methanobacteriota archaeon]